MSEKAVTAGYGNANFMACTYGNSGCFLLMAAPCFLKFAEISDIFFVKAFFCIQMPEFPLSVRISEISDCRKKSQKIYRKGCKMSENDNVSGWEVLFNGKLSSGSVWVRCMHCGKTVTASQAQTFTYCPGCGKKMKWLKKSGD